MEKPRTLSEKILDEHFISELDDGKQLFYVDRILLHEISSPQAFDALRSRGEKLRRPESVLAVADHDVPTIGRENGIADERARHQVEVMDRNARDFNVPYFALDDERHGITHVIAPEQGMILPGTIAVCCDSHATTYGALGAIGFGIGASEVETVLRTNSTIQSRPKTMRVTVVGKPGPGVSAKDMIMAIIGQMGTAGGTGHIIEYRGEAVDDLTMEGRMTLCNMSIEGGARSGLIAPDDKTFAYIKGRPMAPRDEHWEQAVAYWRTLFTDEGAEFDTELEVDVSQLEPLVTWGTSPEDVVSINGSVPDPAAIADEDERKTVQRAIDYMGLTPNMPIRDIRIDRVFIGSCTNSRIEDLVAAAEVLKGRRIAPHVEAMVVPGSGLVKKQAEEMGIDRIFKDAGFSWRDAGCSMCGIQSGDTLKPFERCAASSNRNFENRQGRQGRTHIMNPALAAAAAVAGHLADPRDFA